MRPATFGYAAGEEDGAASDRRCENDWISGANDHARTLTVLRFDDAETGAPISVLFHYAMHGTVFSEGARMLSVDAPGHAEFALESMFDRPVVAMYLQGAAGDASPNTHGNDGTQGMTAAGFRLASTTKRLYDGITTTQRTMPLQATERWVPLSHDLLGYAPGEFFEDGAILCFQATTSNCAEPGAIPTSLVPQVCPTRTLPGEGKSQTRLAAARIGPLALLTLPGEPTSAVGRELTNRAKNKGFEHAVVLGYAQDHNGYMLFGDDWLSGGYEPTISLWGWRFSQYAVERSEALLGDLVAKRRAQPAIPLPDLAPESYEPSAPSASSHPPAIASDVPPHVERFEGVTVAFYGGDAVLGTPEIRLERQSADGGFVPVLTNGWLPVSNLRGAELPLWYAPSPTRRAAPLATSREHRFEVRYEVPRDLPVGSYRLAISGRALVDGTISNYSLASGTFEVGPSQKLSLEGRLVATNGRLHFAGTVLYPEPRPGYAPGPGNERQVSGFRLTEPRFSAPFAPALGGVAVKEAHLETVRGDEAIALAFTSSEIPADNYAPGDGPGLRGEASAPSEGRCIVTIPAGALTDADGNTNGAPLAVSTEL